MVRTHPVTGWKTLFAGGLHCRRVNDVTDFESEQLLSKIISLVGDNHDLQVRFRWNNPGDVGEYNLQIQTMPNTLSNLNSYLGQPLRPALPYPGPLWPRRPHGISHHGYR